MENIVTEHKMPPSSETISYLADRSALKAAGKEIANCLIDSLTEDELSLVQNNLLAKAARLARDHTPRGTSLVILGACEGINEALGKRTRLKHDLPFKTDNPEQQEPPAL